jgi:hypothetical protein
MLKKCLKYDLQAVGRIWWILAASMAGAFLVAALAFRVLLETTQQPDPSGGLILLSIFGTLFAFLCIFAIFAAMTVSVILVYWRTYTHFYTDEGYLTFSLPVKRATLYLSKVLTASIVETSMVLLCILGVALMVLVIPPAEDGALINTMAFQALFEGIRSLANLTGSGWLLAWVIAFLPLPFVCQLFTSGMTFLCLTVGSVIAKKHKLLAAIGIYYGSTTVLSTVGQFAFYFLSSGILGFFDVCFNAGTPISGISVTAVILIVDLAFACMAAVTHFITVNLIERKLNLA